MLWPHLDRGRPCLLPERTCLGCPMIVEGLVSNLGQNFNVLAKSSMLALFLATAACGSDGYSWGIGGPGVPGGGSGSGGSGSGGSGGTGGGGSIYLLTVGRWLLPERQSVFQQAADVCEYAVEMLVEIDGPVAGQRSEEQTSELQSLMRTSYAVFILKK